MRGDSSGQHEAFSYGRARTPGGKVRIFTQCCESQAKKRWFKDDAFRALMRLRGTEIGASAGWTEGFHAGKLPLG